MFVLTYYHRLERFTSTGQVPLRQSSTPRRNNISEKMLDFGLQIHQRFHLCVACDIFQPLRKPACVLSIFNSQLKVLYSRDFCRSESGRSTETAEAARNSSVGRPLNPAALLRLNAFIDKIDFSSTVTSHFLYMRRDFTGCHNKY